MIFWNLNSRAVFRNALALSIFVVSFRPALGGILRTLLLFDSSFTFDTVVNLGLEDNFNAINPGKFFDKVLIVNFSSAASSLSVQGYLYGKPHISTLSEEISICEPLTGRYRVLRKIRTINLFASLLSTFAFLCKLNQSTKFTMVRSEDPSLNGVFGLVISKIFRIPLVVGVWGNPDRIRSDTKAPISPRFFKLRRIEAAVEKIVLTNSKAILVQNDENAEYPLSLGIPSEVVHKIFIGLWIHTGFVQSALAESASLNSNLDESEKLLLFCVSRLEHVKHVEDLVFVSKCLKSRGITFRLSLIGSGSQFNYLQELVVKNDLSDEVEFMGLKSQAWMIKNLPTYHIGLCPLLGRALLEGAMLGIPFVGYDIDWHSELVRNGETGFLVEVGDHNGFAERIAQLGFDPQLRCRMGNNIKRLALEKFRESKAELVLQEVYLNLFLNR